MHHLIDLLMSAVEGRANLADLARELKRDPIELYQWIAGRNLPAEPERADLEARLQRIIASR